MAKEDPTLMEQYIDCLELMSQALNTLVKALESLNSEDTAG